VLLNMGHLPWKVLSGSNGCWEGQCGLHWISGWVRNEEHVLD
jgi:hypothetical protein